MKQLMIGMAIFWGLSVAAVFGQQVINVADDTFLRQGSANKNQNDEEFLRIRQSGKNRTLVAFDQQVIEAAIGGSNLISAVLELNIEVLSNWGSAGRTIDIHRLTEAWTEENATWNCAIDLDLGNSAPDCISEWDGGTFEAIPSVSGILITNDHSGTIQFDLTVDVQDFLLGAPNFGWIIKKTEEGKGGKVEFTSSHPNNPTGLFPKLILTLDGSDNLPPQISFISPNKEYYLYPPDDSTKPEVVIEYSDNDAINPNSLLVELDGDDITDAYCTYNEQLATCSLPSDLSENYHTLEAQIEDQSGNTAQVGFIFAYFIIPPSDHIHDDRYYTKEELNTSGAGGFVHWDNVTNKATLSLNESGNQKTLSFDGGSISFSVDDGDSDAGNELQTLSLTVSGNERIISLSSDGSINFSVNDSDSDDSNELQNLSSSSSGAQRTIMISDGNSTTFDVVDNDNDSNNELQTVSLSGSTVTLSQGGGSFTINDGDFSSSNELQSMSQVLNQGEDAGAKNITNLDEVQANQFCNNAGVCVDITTLVPKPNTACTGSSNALQWDGNNWLCVDLSN